jgi:hypothetical protein
MIKRFIYTLLVLLTVTFSSCKKETYHRIKFEVEFIEDCDNCVADYFAINCTPHYSDEEPGISASDVTTGYVWDYEYWALKDGDKVVFNVSPTGEEYHFKINVYIDGLLVSYRECFGPYGTVLIDQWGINNTQSENATIEFTYYE